MTRQSVVLPIPVPGSIRNKTPGYGGRLFPHSDGFDQRIGGASGHLFRGAVLGIGVCLLSVYLVAALAGASAQSGSRVPTVETIVSRMAQARAGNRARFRPYIVTRDYQLFGKERHRTQSQVIADVAFVPPDVKHYTILQSNGTGLGERLVRRMLEGEVEITKDYGATDMSPANYAFRYLREEGLNGAGCYVLELLPRRKDKNLLSGTIWVDRDTYLIRRAEGQPAKSPSWWVRDVRITLLFSEVSGMWLQTASNSTANVRLLGPHSIASRDTKYVLNELVASQHPPAQAVWRGALIDSPRRGRFLRPRTP